MMDLISILLLLVAYAGLLLFVPRQRRPRTSPRLSPQQVRGLHALADDERSSLCLLAD
jgi:hypothetical protein